MRFTTLAKYLGLPTLAIAFTGWLVYHDTSNPPRLAEAHFAGMDLEQAVQGIADATHHGGATGVLLHVEVGGKRYTATSGVANKASGMPMPKTHPLRIGSVSKVYTAVVVLALSKQGVVDLDAPISDYLPTNILEGLPNGADATVRHLLMHTSGIPDYYDVRSYLLQDWRTPITLERTLPVAKRGEATGLPGQHFTYSNMGYILLGEIAERVSGRAMDALIQEYISSPLELEETYYNVQHPVEDSLHGYGTILRPWADTYDLWEHSGPDGGMMASALDTAKFLSALTLKNGDMHALGEQMLSELIPGEGRQKQGLGLITLTGSDGVTLVGHTGDVFGYQTVAFAIPEYNAVFVGHINCDCGRLVVSMIGNTYRALKSLVEEEKGSSVFKDTTASAN